VRVSDINWKVSAYCLFIVDYVLIFLTMNKFCNFFHLLTLFPFLLFESSLPVGIGQNSAGAGIIANYVG
jgi:hypothetical protein